MIQRSSLGRMNPYGVLLLFLGLVLWSPFLFGCTSGSDNPPYADAGDDRTVYIGQKVWLDGGDSFDREGKPLTYRWEITEKPGGSTALLSDDEAILACFTPDRLGTYRFQLAVHNGTSRSVPDEVVLTAEYSFSAMVPIRTRVVLNRDPSKRENYAIQVGETAYPAPPYLDAPGSSADTGFQLLVLDRQTLAPLNHWSFSGTQAGYGELEKRLSFVMNNHVKGDVLVVLSSLFSAPNLTEALAGAINTWLCNGLGAKTGIGGFIASSNSTYSFIGIPGPMNMQGWGFEWVGRDHTGYSKDDPDNCIRGCLVRDMNEKFVFTFPFTAFETDQEKNTIRVGDRVYPAPVPGDGLSAGKGGFHMLVLNRDSLEPMKNDFYGTAVDVQAMGELNRLGADIHDIAQRRETNRLVILASVGVPFLSDRIGSYMSQNGITQLEQAVNWLGGTEYTFHQILKTPGTTANPARYALLGIPAPADFTFFQMDDGVHEKGGYALRLGEVTDPDGTVVGAVEASTIRSSQSKGNIRGLLRMNRQGWNVPFLSDGGFSYRDGKDNLSGISYELPLILYQEKTPWEHPETEGEDAAYLWVSNYVYYWHRILGEKAKDDLRAAYENYDIDWNTVYPDLGTGSSDRIDQEAQKAIGEGAAFHYGDFCTVRDQLRVEIDHIVQIHKRIESIRDFLTRLQMDETIGLLAFYTNRYKKLKIPPDRDVLMKVLNGINTALQIGAAVVPLLGEKEPAESSGNAVTGAGMGVISALLGFAEQFIHTDTAAQKMGAIDDAIENLWVEMGNSFIKNDFVTLRTYELIVTDWGKMQALYNSLNDWWSSEYENRIRRSLRIGFEGHIYQVLLPILYEIEPIVGTGFTDPSDYGAYSNHQKVKAPNFWDGVSSAWLFNGDVWDKVYESHTLFTLWSQGKKRHSFLESDTWDELLNDPGAGGLGIYKPHLFTRWFPRDLYISPKWW